MEGGFIMGNIKRWKSKAEIEAEINAPKPLSEVEKLKLEQAQANAELVQLILTISGGTVR